MRHDRWDLDSKIEKINAELKKTSEIHKDTMKLLPLHLLPRHLFTAHGLHLNRRGKNRLAEMVVGLTSKKALEYEPPVQTPTATLEDREKLTSMLKPHKINIIEANMVNVIEVLKDDSSVAFSHSISKDFEDNRHMSAGVAVVFREKFERPKTADYVQNKLTCQNRQNGATVYGLVTKARYFGKPTLTDYDSAFAQLEQDFIKKQLKILICSPMGCVRDEIEPECFAHNIVKLQINSGATIGIISYDDQPSTPNKLRKGLSHSEFLKKLKNEILKQEILQAGLPLSQQSPLDPPTSGNPRECDGIQEKTEGPISELSSGVTLLAEVETPTTESSQLVETNIVDVAHSDFLYKVDQVRKKV
uniref:Macro domain-containing protein n=1 Tax=Graphocephala atropunctata TaxID=36148 RepID=A0A1B6M1N6_9HEMI